MPNPNQLGCERAEKGLLGSAQHNFDQAILDRPDWVIPVWNRALSAIHQGRYREAQKYLERALQMAPSEILSGWIRHNLEACSVWEQIQNGSVIPIPPPTKEGSLRQINCPVLDHVQFKKETVWVILFRIESGTEAVLAKILSIPRFAPFRFSDVVLIGQGRFLKEDPLDSPHPYVLETCLASSFRTFFLHGVGTSKDLWGFKQLIPAGSPIHIEPWTLTMRVPGEKIQDEEPDPFVCGMAVPTGSEWDAAHLVRQAGFPVFCPSLMAASGDELNARRHQKQVERLSCSDPKVNPPLQD